MADYMEANMSAVLPLSMLSMLLWVVASSEQCQFDKPTVYTESCRGNNLQISCSEGQRKARPCIGADRNVLTCVQCGDGFFQDKPNNCTECRPCSECLLGNRVSQNCTARRDTECEPEVTSTDVVQRQGAASTRSLDTNTSPIVYTPYTVNAGPQGDGRWIAFLSCLVTGLILGVVITLVTIHRKQLMRIFRRGCTSRCPIRQNEEQPAEKEEQLAEEEEQLAEEKEQPAEEKVKQTEITF
ncbi:uncharacterized protein [Diadema antillarum]|uniref:uncharacterized protein n=1 Tax=Diadema antillarum TaxID=105358 RepID=UPI003A87B7B8